MDSGSNGIARAESGSTDLWSGTTTPAGNTGAWRQCTERLRAALPAICTAGMLGGSNVAGATPVADSIPSVLGEIVVTSQRREERLQDVPLSVSALSADALERLGIQDTLDLVSRVPNFTAVNFGPSQAFTIRGIGIQDFGDANEPPVGVYVDEVYRGTRASQVTQVYDLERVEVLRGPQGTLFGRNVTGGLIHFVSRRPTDVLDGYARLQMGSFDQRIIEGAISGPLSPRVRARLAAKYNKDNGTQRNLGSGGGRLNVTDVIDARGVLEWDVSSSVMLTLMAKLSEQDNTSPGYGRLGAIVPGTVGTTNVPCSPGAVQAATCVFRGMPAGFTASHDRAYSERPAGFLRNDMQFREGTARIDWSIGSNLELVSLSSYATTKREFIEDSDSSTVGITGVGNNRTNRFFVDARQFQQEIRLQGTSRIAAWTVGVFYFDDQKDPVISGPLETFAPGVTFNTRAEVSTRSYAAFAQSDFALSDRLTLTAGARYTHDDKSLKIATAAPFSAVINSGQFDAGGGQITWRLGAEARPSADWMVYTNITTGYKAADFNTTNLGGSVAAAAPVDPEKVTAFEIGTKHDWSAINGQIALAAFYNDYKDKQGVVVQGVAASQLINYGDVGVYGAEFELTTHPVAGLDLQLSAAALKTKVKATPNVMVARDRVPVNYTMDDNQLPGAPKFSASGLIRYTFPVGAAGSAFVQGDVRWQDRVYLDIANSPYDAQDAYAVANFRIGWRSPGDHYLVEAYVDNAFDEQYFARAASFANFDWRFGVWGSRPRSYGIRLGVDF